jgi:hypothetical protein
MRQIESLKVSEAKSVVFTARISRPTGVGTWHYVDVPSSASHALGARGPTSVVGSIDGKPFRGTLLPQGEGRHVIVLNKKLRDEIGPKLGDQAQFVITRDLERREVEVPPTCPCPPS